jgi:predicted MFS family arabinose efflux permease
VPPESVHRATAVIFSAVPLGSVLGVPVGTFVGNIAGWRAAFVVLGVLSGVVLAMLAVALPALPAEQALGLTTLRIGFRGAAVRIALLATLFVVSAGTITVLLLIYGVAGIAGNFLGGALLGRPRFALGFAASAMAAAMLLLPTLGRWEFGAVALLIVWGIGYGGVPVVLQTWFADALPDSPEVASVLFTASFQATFCVGALVGGVIVDRTSPGTVLVCGGATVLLVLLITSGVIDARRVDRAS